eukprot:144306-Karenia_brevis.AAC.1
MFKSVMCLISLIICGISGEQTQTAEIGLLITKPTVTKSMNEKSEAAGDKCLCRSRKSVTDNLQCGPRIFEYLNCMLKDPRIHEHREDPEMNHSLSKEKKQAQRITTSRVMRTNDDQSGKAH